VGPIAITTFRQTLFVILLLWAGCFQSAWAARHALVIGNNAYPSSELLSAVNDARDVAATLRSSGYDVLLRENVTREALFQAIREFGNKLRDGDVAVFYYAGHAIQVRDRNYLIPVDARVKQEDDISYYSLDLAEVLQRMDRIRTRANILILDACRDNPFASTVRFSSVGLAQMSAPSGTLIAYATAPGQVAREGSGRNGVYTKHLLRHMSNPGQPVELTLRRVREGVMAETRGAQVPWDSSSLRGEIVLAGEVLVGAAGTGLGASNAQSSAEMRSGLERTFWESVKDSKDPKEFEAYLDQFPDGVFASLARNRLNLARILEDSTRRAQAAAPNSPLFAPSPATGSGSVVPVPATATLPVPPQAAPQGGSPPAEQMALAANASTPRAIAASPSGPPTRVLTDGSQYQGDLLNGKLHGNGRLVNSTLGTYEGQFVNGKLDGKGRLVSPTLGTYEGDFVNGSRQGKGDLRWPNGDQYVGEFKQDKPSGQGTMRFANGDVYVGALEDGAFSGIGRLTMPNGFSYEGAFVNGIRHGQGRVIFPNGNRYEGEFSKGVVSGRGRMEFADGATYEGEFLNGSPHGNGQYRFADGGRYQGTFRDGLMSGQGVHAYRNGDRHEGQFEAGVPAGKGIRYFSAGGRFEGQFSERGALAEGFMIESDGTRKASTLREGVFRIAGN
jgi:hypothetical protein